MAKVHIKLTTIKRQLQDRMQYPTEHIFEDDDFLTLDEAFDVLLSGFASYLMRNKLGQASTVTRARKQGWMTEKMADLFTNYCINGWKVV